MEAWTKITQRLCDKLVKFFQAMRSWVVFHKLLSHMTVKAPFNCHIFSRSGTITW